MMFGQIQHPRRASASRVWTSLALAAALAACGGKSNDELLSSAAQYLAKGEAKAAVIEAKTALQKSDSARARYLLGAALLATGDAAGAEVELRKAKAAGHPDNEVAPSLAQALLELGRTKDVIAEFAGTKLPDPGARARLATSLGWARAGVGQMAESDAAVADALAAVPGHAPAILLRARLRANAGDAEGALAQLKSIVDKTPTSHEALLLQGEVLLRLKDDLVGATAAFEAAVRAQPSDFQAHAALADLALAKRDWRAAAQVLERAKAEKPVASHPFILYREGQLALGRAQPAVAKDLATQILKRSPEHPLGLEMMGLAEFEMKNWGQALAMFQAALKGTPGLPTARLGSARVHLRLGQTDKALAVLEPMTSSARPPSEALALAAEALLRQQDLPAAEAMFRRASSIDPNNPRRKTEMALVKLGRGDAQVALQELEAIAQSDLIGTSADTALIAAQLRQGQFDAAAMAADRMIKKAPERAVGYHLRGLALSGAKRDGQAREAFERALQLDAGLTASLAQLLVLDDRSGKRDAGVERARAFVKAHPTQASASVLLAAAMRRSGAAEADVEKVLADGSKQNPTDANLRLSWVRHLLEAKHVDRAITVAQEAVAALPDHAGLLESLGVAQLRGGQNTQALATFGKLVALQPNSPAGHLRIAELHATAKNLDAARASLKRAEGVDGGSTEVLTRRVAIEVADGKFDEALRVSQGISKRLPAKAIGYTLEGDSHAAAGRWTQAAAAYKAAAQKEALPLVVIKQYGALLKAGKEADAESVAAKWAKDHPRDAVVPYGMGEILLARGDYARAESRFASVLKITPQSHAALNNLAWARLQRGAAGALTFAQKADALRPRSPPIMETLALALAAEGRAKEALPLLEEAVKLAPEHHGIRLSLAKTYLQLNQKAQAKTELERLDRLGPSFARRAEVSKLLATL